MNSKLLGVSLEGVDNEADVLCWNPFNGFLDDMVSILVHDALQHVSIELFDECRLLIG